MNVESTRTSRRAGLGARLRVPLFVASLVIGLTVLDRAGQVLAPLPSWSGAWDYALHTDPLVVCFSLLRVVGVVLCWYLLATTVLSALAHASRRPNLVRVVDAVTLPPVRRLVRGAAGLGLATSIGLSGVSATVLLASRPVAAVAEAAPAPTAPAPATAPPTMRVVGPPVAGPTMRLLPVDAAPASTSTSPATRPTATMRVLPTEPAPPSTTALPAPASVTEPPTPPTAPRPPVSIEPRTTTTQPAATPSDPTTTPTETDRPAPAGDPVGPLPTSTGEELAPPAPDTSPRSWTITPGDHLWHVASETLRTTFGHPPSDAETATYLQRLIDANRATFAVPGNADLVFPGQVFALPST